MTGQIINLHGDIHRDILALLPWHVTGQLDAADAARVAAHLDGCAGCRVALDAERRLDRELGREPASADQGWAAMRQRLEFDRPAVAPAGVRYPAAPAARPVRRGWPRWPIGWSIGAPLALASAVGVVLASGLMPARYAALGSAPAAATGNVVVIFRPETSEAVFRQALRGSDARLVDGPTSANAYVLQVPDTRRAASLDHLRRQPQVVLAEPIDAGQRP